MVISALSGAKLIYVGYIDSGLSSSFLVFVGETIALIKNSMEDVLFTPAYMALTKA